MPVPSHRDQTNKSGPRKGREGGARDCAINQKGTLWGMPINVPCCQSEARTRHGRDGRCGIQNGASILDAVASPSATKILVDFQTNSELIDSLFQSIFLHAIVFFASLLGPIFSVPLQAGCQKTHLEYILYYNLSSYIPFVYDVKSGILEQIAAPFKTMENDETSSHVTHLPVCILLLKCTSAT